MPVRVAGLSWRSLVLVLAACLAMAGCSPSHTKSSAAHTSVSQAVDAAHAHRATSSAHPSSDPPDRPAGLRSQGADSSSATPSADLCGAPANPYGYTFCGGRLIRKPRASTCNYFNCISSFDDGSGYMIECADGKYSMSGGLTKVCRHHGGPTRPVRQSG